MYKEPGAGNMTKLKREIKITDNKRQNKDFREVDDFLKTLTKNFMKEPPSLESLDKAYYEMVDKKKVEDNEKNKGKKKEEKAIFYDIFIKPKESKISEIHNKRVLEKKIKEDLLKKKIDLNDNFVVKTSNNKKVKSFFTNRMKGYLNKVQKPSSNEEVDNNSNYLFAYLSNKFIPHLQDSNKNNFFNQLIQIKPPEGINAIVASPLMEGT